MGLLTRHGGRTGWPYLGGSGSKADQLIPPCAARLAWSARMAASSASTFFFCSSVSTTAVRGGGMSCTAGYAGGVAGRSGVPRGSPPTWDGNPPIWDGMSDNVVVHDATAIAAAQATANVPIRRHLGPIVRLVLCNTGILAASLSCERSRILGERHVNGE
jgi:hypothetical protein